MRSFLWAMGFAGALAFATVASATTCPTDTWCFGSNPTTVGDGATYSTSSGPSLGTVTVYSEQVTNSNNKFYSSSDSTLSGLFSTNDSVYDEGIGIAPYNPAETSSSNFSNQDGLTDVVGTNNHGGTNSAYGNVLVLELGSNIADGTTLSFLLQAGNGDGNVGTDKVAAYYLDGGTSANLSPSSMTQFAQTTNGQISTNGTTSQFSITKNTTGVEWIAIEADCHYILLDTITGAPPSGVPEPRFYGLLLAAFLGLGGMVYQRRRAAQINA
jgi:hypothetical protein